MLYNLRVEKAILLLVKSVPKKPKFPRNPHKEYMEWEEPVDTHP